VSPSSCNLTHRVGDADDDVRVAGGEVPDGEAAAARHNDLEQAADRPPPRFLHGRRGPVGPFPLRADPTETGIKEPG